MWLVGHFISASGNHLWDCVIEVFASGHPDSFVLLFPTLFYTLHLNLSSICHFFDSQPSLKKVIGRPFPFGHCGSSIGVFASIHLNNSFLHPKLPSPQIWAQYSTLLVLLVLLVPFRLYILSRFKNEKMCIISIEHNNIREEMRYWTKSRRVGNFKPYSILVNTCFWFFVEMSGRVSCKRMMLLCKRWPWLSYVDK